jgi:tRNA threonylcarbamoyladenosine biosynthesis protein TsaE
MELIYRLDDAATAAKTLLHTFPQATVFALNGEMGAGKTTFVSVICKVLGIKDAVASPTYTIINEYLLPSAESVFHMDLYRLNDIEEAVQAGVEEALNSGNLCFVEWPEKAATLIPEDAITLHFELVNADTRRLRIGDK